MLGVESNFNHDSSPEKYFIFIIADSSHWISFVQGRMTFDLTFLEI